MSEPEIEDRKPAAIEIVAVPESQDGGESRAPELDSGSELPFLVTQWLANYKPPISDERKKKEALEAIQTASKQLAQAFKTLGAFGTCVDMGDTGIRDASYEDVSVRWSHNNPLEHLVHAAQQSTIASLQAAASKVDLISQDSSSIIMTSLIKRAIEEDPPIEDSSKIVSLLQPPTLLTSTEEVRRSKMPSTTNTTLSPTLETPKTLASGNSVDSQLTLALDSNPSVLRIKAAVASRNYVAYRTTFTNQRENLQRLERDLDRANQTLESFHIHGSKDLMMEAQRVSAFLSAQIPDVKNCVQEAHKSMLDAHEECTALCETARIHGRYYLNPFSQISSTLTRLHPLATWMNRAPQSVPPSFTPNPNPTQTTAIRDIMTVNVLHAIQRRSIQAPSCLRQRLSNSFITKQAVNNRLSHVVTINAHLFYPVYCLRFDRTGKYFVTGADDQLVKLFVLGDASNQNKLSSKPRDYGATLVCTMRGHASVITDIDVNLDSAMVATGSEDGDCRVWGLRDGSPIAVLRGHEGGVTMVSFSLTCPYRLVTLAEDGYARIWDVREAALQRYVNIVGTRKNYLNPSFISPRTLKSNSNLKLSPTKSSTALANAIAKADSEDDDEEMAEAAPTSSLGHIVLDDPPLPPIPLGPEGTPRPKMSTTSHASPPPPVPNGVVLPPIPNPSNAAVDSRNNAPGDDHIIVAPRIGPFAPAQVVDGNEAILDEGVKLLTRLYHGNDTSLEEDMQGMATRGRRRKIKVICIARCPIGGHFATGTEDGVVRIWRDIDDHYLNSLEKLDRQAARRVYENLSSSPDSLSSVGTPSPEIPDKPLASRLLATLQGHLNSITDIKYSSRGDRLLTASQKDGVVRIWSWDSTSEIHGNFKQVRHVMIRLVPVGTPLTSRTPSSRSSPSNRGRRATASRGGGTTSATQNVPTLQCDVANWSANDLYIITSQSIPVKRTGPPDYQQAVTGVPVSPLSQVIQIWDSFQGQCLVSIQGAHAAPCHVIVPHPQDPFIFLSAGSDGIVHLWDVQNGTRIHSWENRLQHGALTDPRCKEKFCGFLDGTWKDDGTTAILTDDSGRIIIFDTSLPRASNSDRLVPVWMKEQYFASDYYELLYDLSGYALDSRSNLPPHIAPRAVRCNHVGTNSGDAMNYALLDVKGPLPLSESICSDRMHQLMLGALLVRHQRTVFGDHLVQRTWIHEASSRVSGVTIGRTQGSIVVKGPLYEAADALELTLSASSRRLASRTGLGRQSLPQHLLSSRYNYLGYEDIVSSDAEDSPDEDFVPGQPESNRTLPGRSLTGLEQQQAPSRSQANASDDDESVSLVESDHSLLYGSDDSLEPEELDDHSPVRRRRPRRATGQQRAIDLSGGRRLRDGREITNRTQNQGRRQPSRPPARRSDSLTVVSEPIRQSRAARARAAPARYARSDSESDDNDLLELLSTNKPPESPEDYNGNYFEDIHRGHMWKMSRAAKVKRDWLIREESKSGFTGKKSYAPQLGDSVVYIPRAHYDTIIKHPAAMMHSAPWKSFPSNSAWPVLLCKVKAIRYRFPIEILFKDGYNAVVAIVTLEMTGIPKMRTGHGFPWPMPEFIQQQSRSNSKVFEVSLFQCGEIDFLIPEALYLWRQVSLETAIRLNHGNPRGITVHAFYENNPKSRNDDPYTTFIGEMVSIDGILVTEESDGTVQIEFGQQTQECELHFQQSGYSTIQVAWRNDAPDTLCPWDLNVSSTPVGDMPQCPAIPEAMQIDLIEKLSEILRENERIKSYFAFPVDTSVYSDYNMLVEVPIDLSFVQRRLEQRYYSTLDSFMADIKLIENNCRKYNDSRGDVVVVARELTTYFTKAVNSLSEKYKDVDSLQDGVVQRELQNRVEKITFPQLGTSPAPNLRLPMTGPSIDNEASGHARPRRSPGIPELLEPSSLLSNTNSRYFAGPRNAGHNSIAAGQRRNPSGRRGRTTSGELHLQTTGFVPMQQYSREINPQNTLGAQSSTLADLSLRRSSRERRPALSSDFAVPDSSDDEGFDTRRRAKRKPKTSGSIEESKTSQYVGTSNNGADSSRSLRQKSKVNYKDAEINEAESVGAASEEQSSEADIGKPLEPAQANVKANSYSTRSGRPGLRVQDHEHESTEQEKEESEDEVQEDSDHSHENQRSFSVNLRPRSGPKIKESASSVQDRDYSQKAVKEHESSAARVSLRIGARLRNAKATQISSPMSQKAESGRGTRRGRINYSGMDSDGSSSSPIEIESVVSVQEENGSEENESDNRESEDESEASSFAESSVADDRPRMGRISGPRASARTRATRQPSKRSTRAQRNSQRKRAISTNYKEESDESEESFVSSEEELPPPKQKRRVRGPRTMGRQKKRTKRDSDEDSILSESFSSNRDEESDYEERAPKNNVENVTMRGLPKVSKWREFNSIEVRVRITRTMLSTLREMDSSGAFATPVVEAYPALKNDYLKKVSRPMCFLTVEKNLRKYRNIKEIRDDLILIFLNCVKYNGPTHDLGKEAIAIWQQLDTVFQEACEAEGII